jgi:hypothetical protein
MRPAVYRRPESDMSPLRAWMRFWFEPSPPTDLGISRLLFFGGLLLMYAGVDFSAWGDVSPAFWMPLPAFDILQLRPLSRHALEGAELVWRLSLLTSAIGFQTRASMWVAFGLGFYLLGLPHNFGHTFHFDATIVIAMGVLACSRAGDAWSVDTAIGKRTPTISGDYTWPLRAIWVAMSAVFLAAGIAKLRIGGLEWVFSSNLSIILTRAAYHVSDADPITGIGLGLAQHEWLARGLAGATLFIELGFVSALFSRAARFTMVPAAAGMIIGIRVLMGPTFGGFLLNTVFFVPWSEVLDALAVRAKARAHRTASAPPISSQHSEPAS